MANAVASEVTFAQEDGKRILVEGMPLFQEHWREIATHQDIELAPHVAAYEAAADSGSLKAFTARADSYKLIGYAVYFVNPSLHYMNSLQAAQDILFVRKEYRRGTVGMRLIAYADEQLRRMGVQVVYQHVKAAHNFGPLLERLGYQHVEHIYSRRLDK